MNTNELIGKSTLAYFEIATKLALSYLYTHCKARIKAPLVLNEVVVNPSTLFLSVGGDTLSEIVTNCVVYVCICPGEIFEFFPGTIQLLSRTQTC